MSISQALNNALSGLGAASRAASVVSDNVANAATPGYARREVELTARVLGGEGAGVAVVGVNRVVDPVLTAERRMAETEMSGAKSLASFYDRLSAQLGDATDLGLLEGRVSTLESALVAAATRPDAEAQLLKVVQAAKGVTDGLNAASDSLSRARMSADTQIARQVTTLNENLNAVVELNIQINRLTASGRDANALLDQRSALIDEISRAVPVREVPRENGMVSLYTPDGRSLIDTKAAQFEFTPTAVITPDISVATGALSQISMNGQTVTIDQFHGGELAALFDIRDRAAPDAQAGLDAIARDLAERFTSSTVDPTQTAVTGALFTDGPNAFDTAFEQGLSGRIRLNGLVDPEAGGAVWRLRDGLGATSQGAPGDATILNNLIDAIQTPRSVTTVGGQRNFGQFVTDFVAGVKGERLDAEDRLSYASALFDGLTSAEMENGVDTDAELQSLLLIERSYAANAKVIQAVSDLLERLTEIV